MKHKVFSNNTLEQCLNLQENGEEEMQHRLLLLSNGFPSRCAGTAVVSASTLQGGEQCHSVTPPRSPNQSPACLLSSQFSETILPEVKTTLSNIYTEKFGALLEKYGWICRANAKGTQRHQHSCFISKILLLSHSCIYPFIQTHVHRLLSQCSRPCCS